MKSIDIPAVIVFYREDGKTFHYPGLASPVDEITTKTRQSLALSFAQRRKAREDAMHENEISKEVVDAALKIHRALGPGLLESVYEVVLAHELRSRGLSVQRQLHPF